jgi:hypothetical protein
MRTTEYMYLIMLKKRHCKCRLTGINSESGNKAGKGMAQYFLPFRDYNPQYSPLSPKGKVQKR